jgi:exodeoxyribonuclease-3
MKIISINTNGIRAAARKGFFEWMLEEDADVICIQETKAQLHQLDDPIFKPAGYHRYFFDAEKKGYSGVAIYCKKKPNNVSTGLGWTVVDTEGRYIQVDFDDISVASLYLPSGTSGDERQQLKYEFLDAYYPILEKIAQSDKECVICGDFNIVHKEIDIKNWKSNQKNSGCLPKERAWLDKIFDQIGLVDTFRVDNQEPHQYTWWSNRGQAYANNVGWRIDYQVATPGLKNKITSSSVYKAQRFSDHAPLIINYDYTL